MEKPDFEQIASFRSDIADVSMFLGFKSGCEHVWNTYVAPLQEENKALHDEVERLKANHLTGFTEDELKNLFAGYDHFFYTPNEYFSGKGIQMKQNVRKKIDYIRETVLFPKLDV